MKTFSENMLEYRDQLKKGAIQNAYKGLMDYVLNLRNHMKSKYPDCSVSGSLYFGYMDMTYFSFTPSSLKDRDLKIAIVFVHETFRFEAWLAAVNKQVQEKYWKFLKDSGWDKYRLVPDVKGNDAILEHVLVGDPDFAHLDALTAQIEKEAVKFIKTIEQFLSAQSLGN
jgi:hypothetical protein